MEWVVTVYDKNHEGGVQDLIIYAICVISWDT